MKNITYFIKRYCFIKVPIEVINMAHLGFRYYSLTYLINRANALQIDELPPEYNIYVLWWQFVNLSIHFISKERQTYPVYE